MDASNYDLEGIIKQHGTPVLLISRATLREGYQRLTSLLPGAKLYYSIKANPDPIILDTLNLIGSNFDVTSPGELEHLHKLGVSNERIIYTNPIKQPGWISPEEAHEILEYLNQGAPEAEKPVRQEATGGPSDVFRQRCTACHTPERVFKMVQIAKEADQAPQWMHIVKRMRQKAPEWITEDEAVKIVEFLQTLKPVSKP